MGYRGGGESCLLMLCLLLIWSHAVEGGGRWDLSKAEDLEIERQLKIINKPHVMSFKTEHGDIFDCVDIYKQPAFDHPLLKDHKLEMRPSLFPKGAINETSSRENLLKTSLNKRCPVGTVLIHRTQKEDLVWAKKHAPYIRPLFDTNDGNHMLESWRPAAVLLVPKSMQVL